MTADRLDEQAEARIREACVNLRGGSDSDRSGDEWHNPGPYDFDAPNATCLCRDLRAAILADREARVVTPIAEPEQLRMSAYYYGFARTGDALVDRILSAVAHAGKGYHHTDGWNNDQEDIPPFRGGSYVGWIQNAARDAADARKAERAHADDLAGASRGFLLSALRFYSSQPAHDDRFEGALAALRDVLAAHDKRRGK